MRGTLKQAEANITTETDTLLVAAPEVTQHLEVEEVHVCLWTAQAAGLLRFEDAAGGNELTGMGCANGSNVLNHPIHRPFKFPYKIAAGKGISVETTGTAAWMVFVKYRLVDTLG